MSASFGEVPRCIDEKNRFITFFKNFGQVFLTFLTFFLFSKRFLFLKSVGKVHSGTQINKK